jgi:hypothetical protein
MERPFFFSSRRNNGMIAYITVACFGARGQHRCDSTVACPCRDGFLSERVTGHDATNRDVTSSIKQAEVRRSTEGL